MKLLFIGGTGLISSACSELAGARVHELFILNRSVSRKYPLPEGATLLQADIHEDEAALATLLPATDSTRWSTSSPLPRKASSAISASFGSGPASLCLSAQPRPTKNRSGIT